MKLSDKGKIPVRILVLFGIMFVFFLIVSIYAGELFDPGAVDFAAYWQAGHMVLQGQNVYDTRLWVAERYRLGTAYHSEPTFQYPLPFAILLAPLGWLSVKFGYILWIFLGQLSILASVLILLNFYPKRLRYTELVAVAGVFLFRPTFIVISNGQVMPFLLLFITLAIYLFRIQKWFFGGLILSFLSLKPSIALPILILIGFWLLIKRQWNAILGLFSGGVTLLLLGVVINSHWLADYLAVGQQSFTKYYGMQTTLWSLVGLFFPDRTLGTAFGALLVISVLIAESWFLIETRAEHQPFATIATILPIALLTAPYSWSYDQILLIIPIIYILVNSSHFYGEKAAAFAMVCIVLLAIILVLIAYILKHDVWSLLNSVLVISGVLFFYTKKQYQF